LLVTCRLRFRLTEPWRSLAVDERPLLEIAHVEIEVLTARGTLDEGSVRVAALVAGIDLGEIEVEAAAPASGCAGLLPFVAADIEVETCLRRGLGVLLPRLEAQIEVHARVAATRLTAARRLGALEAEIEIDGARLVEALGRADGNRRVALPLRSRDVEGHVLVLRHGALRTVEEAASR